MDLTSADEVSAAVQRLRSERRRALVVGGGTGLGVLDDAPADERLEVSGISGVTDYEPEDLTCTLGAGTTLGELRRVLAEHGQTLPVWHPDPDRATLGGLVASGWSGLGRRLYGRLRDRVLEVRAVTGEAKLVRGGGRVVKNVTGFDLPRLFAGSLGTLGVLVELTVKVHPAPGPLHARTVTGPPGQTAEALRRLALNAPVAVEAVMASTDGRWTGYAFAPGPPSDAASLLDPLGGEEADPSMFERLAPHPLLAPAADGGIVVRAAVPPGDAAALVAEVAGSERALVDVASGVAWTKTTGDGLAALRGFCEARGGSAVLLAAPPEVRRRYGTWGSAPQAAAIMARLKTLFDPDGIFPDAGFAR